MYVVDVNTSSVEFVKYAKRAMRLLAEDAIAELPSMSVEVTTPCGSCQGVDMDTENVCAVSIVRSGDALLESIRDCIPEVKVGKILIQRQEESASKEAVLYYSKLPPNVHQNHILLCDPMLATGGSAKMAIQTLTDQYQVPTQNIIFANMISCPEGLRAMADSYPEITIVTACVDPCLNEDKYIVPGLGDYGDRFFNT